uniref:Granulins domain-containing protein n=1 Tax=Hucho hucho TaxID=62062 RepID=A0A4W5K6J1_9TELE
MLHVLPSYASVATSSLTTLPSSTPAEPVVAVMCSDRESECPEGTTCCETPDGSWGCCPMPKAVCCADGEHCCPKDYICDMSKTSCSKGGVAIPWYNKLAAEPDDSALSAPLSVKCDTQNRCPEGSSCCQLFTGQWGCCPLRKVCVCVSEGVCWYAHAYRESFAQLFHMGNLSSIYLQSSCCLVT